MLPIYIHMMKNIISNLHANLLLFLYITMLCIQEYNPNEVLFMKIYYEK